MPPELAANRVHLSVAPPGGAPGAANATFVEVAHGTPMSEVKAAVYAANPNARVVEVRGGADRTESSHRTPDATARPCTVITPCASRRVSRAHHR